MNCASAPRSASAARNLAASSSPDGNAEHEVTFAEMLGILARVVGVVAEHALNPALDGAGQSVRLALDVDPANVMLARHHVVTVGCEARLRQALASTVQ